MLEPGTYTLTVESYVADSCTQTNFNSLLCPDDLTAETAMRGYDRVTTCEVFPGACSTCSASLGPPPPVACVADGEGPQPPCGPGATCNRTDV